MKVSYPDAVSFKNRQGQIRKSRYKVVCQKPHNIGGKAMRSSRMQRQKILKITETLDDDSHKAAG